MLSPAITFTVSAVRSLPLPPTMETNAATESGFLAGEPSHQVFHAEDFMQILPSPGIWRFEIRHAGRNAAVRPHLLSLKQVLFFQLRDFEEGMLHFLQMSGRIIGDYLLFGGEIYHYAKPIPPEAVKNTLTSPDIRHHFFAFVPARDETWLETLIWRWTATLRKPDAREAMMRRLGYVSLEEAEAIFLRLALLEKEYEPSLRLMERETVFGMVSEKRVREEFFHLLQNYLDRILGRYKNSVMRTLRKQLRDPDAVDEVWQKFCVIVLSKWGSFEGRASIIHWFNVILKNCKIDHLKDESRRLKKTAGSEDISLLPDWTLSPEVLLTSPSQETEIGDELEEALETLRPEDLYLLLQSTRGISLSTNARRLGISVPAASSRLRRTRGVLRKLLG